MFFAHSEKFCPSGCGPGAFHPSNQFESCRPLSSADLLLHTTPVGMHPREDNTLVLPELLHPGLTVFDAVYNPRRTRLLRDAAQRGCRVIEGLEMFLGQAAVQFELWTGVPAPTQVFRAVVEASL